MPWVPTTDFEDEVVNLQPHHDFIYGFLSEPEYTYPRPKAHTEYAVSKNIQNTTKEQRKDSYVSSGEMNGKLYAIQQVQRMANTKAVGEQATVDDWENNKKIEQETIGMIRYYGMGVSVEQPLNPKLTIATHPVENNIKIVTNGRRKVALFFDENVFKLKEKVSDTSSGFESCNNSESNEYTKQENDSYASNLEGGSNVGSNCNTSFMSTTSQSSSTSFSTIGDNSDTIYSLTPYKSSSSVQYEKLLEDTALLSLDSIDQQNVDSFQTAADDDSFSWKPISEEDEDIFDKQENWPNLCDNIGSRSKNQSTSADLPQFTEYLFNKSPNDSLAEGASDVSSNSSKKSNFLDRFIKIEHCDTLNTPSCSEETTSSSSLSQEPITYAAIVKAPKTPAQSLAKPKGKVINKFPNFYSPRRLYELKRHPK